MGHMVTTTPYLIHLSGHHVRVPGLPGGARISVVTRTFLAILHAIRR